MEKISTDIQIPIVRKLHQEQVGKCQTQLIQDDRKSNFLNFLIEKIFFACGLTVIIILVVIVSFLFYQALPALREVGIWTYLSDTRWMPSSPIEPGYGALPFIVGSVIVTVGALVIGVPWGIFAAIFISEIAPTKLKEILKPIIEILAIFPSVVLGFIALVVISPIVAHIFKLSNGLTGLTGSIILAIMTLPTIISIVEDSLKSVPKSYREAAYALGISKWDTIRFVVVPAAKSSIIAAVMLGFGRAVGETMTVLMATGNALNMPVKDIMGMPVPTLLRSLRTLTANIAIEGGDVAWGSLHYHSLFVIGFILFVITFIVNWIADHMLSQFEAVNKHD